MRQKLLILLPITLAASSVMAQMLVNVDTFGRYQINNAFTATPVVSDFSWGPSVATFGFAPGSAANAWAQVVQFDTGSSTTDFNNASTFEFSLQNFQSGGRSFDIYVATGSTDLTAFGAGANIIKNSGIGLGGTQIASGLIADGTTITLNNNTTLNSVLSGTDFSSAAFVYFTFRPDSAGSAGSSVATYTGTSLTAVPEPSTYALLAGVMTLGLVMLRRRRKQA